MRVDQNGFPGDKVGHLAADFNDLAGKLMPQGDPQFRRVSRWMSRGRTTTASPANMMLFRNVSMVF